jgi:ribosomal protein S18 acetylase RimI-like enzyme
MQTLCELSHACELAAYRAATPQRNLRHFGAFVALLDPYDDLPWLNYAFPVAPLGPSAAADLQELAAYFVAHQRQLRFEFHAAPWPDLPPLLAAQGLHLAARQPVLACTAATLRPPPHTAFQTRMLSADAPLTELAAVVTIQQLGFGGSAGELTELRLQMMRHALQAQIERYALAYYADAPVGAGSLLPAGAFAEIVGVATHPSFRRRGVAATLCAALAAAHFAAGGIHCWLSAGDAAAQRVYERIGFQVIDDRLNYELPG